MGDCNMSIGKKILVIDDEEDIRELLNYNLTKEGYKVLLASDGNEGLRIIREQKPDLIVLDLMLPGLDGLDVCRIVKNDRDLKNIPIVMLTAKGEEEDIINGLDLGADDYITKPFSVSVLIARIKTVFRRMEPDARSISSSPIYIGPIVIDPQKYMVTVNDNEIKLTTTEFNILKTLAENENKVLTRKQLLRETQGNVDFVTERTIDVHLTSLRKKLGRLGWMIQTVRGVGYRLKNETK